MENRSTKQVLLNLVQEIEELRALLLVVSAHPTLKMSLADAQEAKAHALKADEGHYAALRKEIEAL
jgi:hypothetical protein